jgi:hypothetical protein
MTLTVLAERGCLPVGIDRDRNAVVLRPLMDLPFQEAKYLYTLRANDNRASYTWPVARFIDEAAALPPGPATGLIGHVSRCGSTLLTNLLALRRGTLVLKEPGFLAPTEPELLRALLDYCGSVARIHGRELVVKPASWTSPALFAATATGPQRWLLLWRDPFAVVSSLLAAAPNWASRTELTNRVCDNRTEFYAAVWSAIVTAFTSGTGQDERRLRFLDYETLVVDKGRALVALQTWFGLGDADEVPSGFEAEQGRYSKASDATGFDPAGAHHRPPLTPADAAAVSRETKDAMAALRTTPDELHLLGPA